MFTMHFALLAISSHLFAAVSAAACDNPPIPVHLRIEGKYSTIFEGVVVTCGHPVTTQSGGTHQCNGMNNNASTYPGATCTSALSDAAKERGFTFDGTFFPSLDDFQITEIAGEKQTPNEASWLIAKNFQWINVGGCQEKVTRTDEVLFALAEYSDIRLKLSGPSETTVRKPVVFKVTNGESGRPVAGASVYGKTTGADGTVSILFTAAGEQSIKATKSGAIRSNTIDLVVEQFGEEFQEQIHYAETCVKR